MTREQAIIQGLLTLQYLATYEPRAYSRLAVAEDEVNIYYTDYDATPDDVARVKKRIEAIVIAGTEIDQINENVFSGLIITWRIKR